MKVQKILKKEDCGVIKARMISVGHCFNFVLCIINLTLNNKHFGGCEGELKHTL
jgi:hypothetical protein